MTNAQQDIIVNQHATLSWDTKAQFFLLADPDPAYLALAHQAHKAARNPEGRYSELATFMSKPPKEWTPATNDQIITLWMASGDLKYLTHIQNHLNDTNTLVAASGAWALKALKRMYAVDF
jgi:hypothetical protein